jgi:CRP-like cAMP-binding protein
LCESHQNISRNIGLLVTAPTPRDAKPRRQWVFNHRRAHPGVLVNNLSSTPMQNHLLAQLPMLDRQRWLPHLEFVHLPLGEVIYEAGDTLAYVYFPTTAIVSLLYVLENGSSAEIAVVGNEGIVGVSLFMGGDSTPSRAVVQSAR